MLVPVRQAQLVPTGTGKGQKRPLLVPWDKSYTHAGGLPLSRDKLYTHDGACPSSTYPNWSHKVGLQGRGLFHPWAVSQKVIFTGKQRVWRGGFLTKWGARWRKELVFRGGGGEILVRNFRFDLQTFWGDILLIENKLTPPNGRCAQDAAGIGVVDQYRYLFGGARRRRAFILDPNLTMHLATTEAIRSAAHGQSATQTVSYSL